MNLFREIRKYDKKDDPLWLKILKPRLSNFKYECKWERYFQKKADILIEKIKKNSEKTNYIFMQRWKGIFFEINKYKYKNKIISVYYHKDWEYLPLIRIDK